MQQLRHFTHIDFKKRPTKKQLAIGVGSFLGLLILLQVLFPADRLLPFAKIDRQHVGGWQKKDVGWQLNSMINQTSIPVHRGDEAGIYLKAKPEALGVTIDTVQAVEKISYPWYMRLIPSSIFWYGSFQEAAQYRYSFDSGKTEQFIKNELANCKLAPQNATLVYQDKKLELIKAKNGGICEPSEVTAAVKQLRPTKETPVSLTFPAIITPPQISDEAAGEVKEYLDKKEGNIAVVAGDKRVKLPYETVRSWLLFTNTGKKLTYSIDQKKSDAYLKKFVAPLVTVAPGVTKITTRDFTEISRKEGTSGKTLDAAKTRQSILEVAQGTSEKVVVKSIDIPAKVDYTRTYSSSDVGLSALLQQFAEDNKGSFGVQYIELTGKKRRADYNQSKQFITASTYKLFVAYSTLKRVELGQWSWNDQVTGGQNLTTCFDKMIVNSDNACAEALYGKIGYQTVINEARGLGLSRTVLDKDGQKTSAGDLATFLGSVYSGTIDLNSSSRNRLIAAMKRNVYRQGIPAGANGTVADKVGFLNGLFHDASIVYSGRGDYVLVVMTDGSSWSKIAELTKKIESIR